MTDVRIYNVLRVGPQQTAVSRIGRDEVAAARNLAAREAGSGLWLLAGRWRVRDHTDTIAALCGPWGRL